MKNQKTPVVLLALAATVVLSAAGTGFADVSGLGSGISGFGSGSGYTLTGYTQDANGNITDTNAPTITSSALTITTASAGEARAAFFNTPPVHQFFHRQFHFPDGLYFIRITGTF